MVIKKGWAAREMRRISERRGEREECEKGKGKEWVKVEERR